MWDKFKGRQESVQKWLSDHEDSWDWLTDKLAAASDTMTWKRWAVAAVLALLVFVGVCTAIFRSSSTPRASISADQPIYVSVKPGMSASDIGDELVKHGVLESKFSFWWKVKTSDAASQFKSGVYAMKPNMAAEEVLRKLVSGDTTVVKFTIPEGFGVKEIAKRLADEGLVEEQEFLAKAKKYAPYDYIERKDDIRYACEGFLFPDTYELHEDPTPESIMKMMAEDFDTRLTPELRARAREMNLSIFDLITLASLVEKEALYAEDRPIIAQVFFKRLKIGMPLQSDTTLQYLLDAPKEDVSIKDTKIESPYNTYQHRGLPPGPIASPGMAAIKAVLYPADTDYLYFVADRKGHNHYSTNYADHQVIVNQVR
ncbi:MAG: endolytic transglycosylase MltG [Selenomonadaceae bacterium]|nr:endolytic transglycosylase MltG [Selenomonadaceae bacterium]